MAGKVRHLINRSGRYHARLVVPKGLRGIVGKTELREPLGADYRQALKLLPGAVARLQHEIALAEQKADRPKTDSARYPLTPDQLAYSHYMQRLDFDDELRNDPRYAMVGIDDFLVERLRAAVAGRATDDELRDLIGIEVNRFRKAGNLTAAPGTNEWRIIARALCSAELEALERVAERDDGDFSGKPTNPLIVNAQPPQEPPPQVVHISSLWEDYKRARIQAGFMKDGGRRQDPVIANLRRFLRHDNAARVTKKDILNWRDHLMQDLKAKTVSDVYLSTVRSLFSWAELDDRLPENVAASVKQPKPRRQYGRERGYTDAEAIKVFEAVRNYVPKDNKTGRNEKPYLTAAKRWCPLICAFTGARISEITQLRKEDMREENGRWIIRITPEAGSVKAGDFRDIPLHQQLIDLGFADFVKASKPGPLFHGATDPKKFFTAASSISDEIAKWLRRSGLTPDGIWPSHGWRHRFKTVAREIGASDRVVDAICGHASKSAGDSYGDVTLAAKAKVIDAFPRFQNV